MFGPEDPSGPPRVVGEEALAAAAEAQAEADPIGTTLSSMIDATESAMNVVGDVLEEAIEVTSDAIEATLGGAPSAATQTPQYGAPPTGRERPPQYSYLAPAPAAARPRVPRP